MTTPLLTLPNQITILRMALAPVLVVLVLEHQMRWALAVFFVAGMTDLLDGLAARLGHQKTTLGAMLDPVADKVLLTACFVVLTWASGLVVSIPVWLTVTALSRDAIIVTSVTVINLAHGRRIFYPSLLGKASTASQLLTVGAVFLLNALGRPRPEMFYLFLLTMVLTVGSAFHYVYLASTGKTGTAAP